MGSRLQAQELPQTLEGAGTISLCLEDRVASRGAGGGGAGAENGSPLYPPTGLRFLGPLSLWNKRKQHLVRVWGCWTLLPSLSSFVYPFLVTV